MSTPTKFNQGGVPRTRTGLIPTSYTRTLDNLTFQLEELPTKPPQPKYKYRGDYVNERNRKILHERKLAQKQRQQSLLDRSKRSEKSVDSFGSTINSSTDNSNKDDKPPTPYNTKNQWDSYCKHISCHKLSENEELSRIQNKKKFVSFLRCEALKRQDRSPTKKEEVLEIAVVRKKKPPVPRLSRLARSGGKQDNKENRENGKKTATSRQTAIKCPRTQSEASEKDTIKDTIKPKVRYLDFISKKADTDEPPSKLSLEENTNTSKHKQISDSTDEKDEVSRRESNKPDDDNDDDSKFRIQIERIVERAAEIVLKEQQDDRASTSSLIDESNTGDTSNGTSDSSPGIDRNKKSTCSILDNNDLTQLQQQKYRLSMLEDQVRSMSSSVASEHEFSLSPSHIEQAAKSTSSMTEIVPRSAPVLWQQCFGQKSVADLLQSIDSSSYASGSFLTGSDSSSRSFSDVRALKHIQAGDILPIVDENETVTSEVQPRMQAIHPSQALENRCPSLDLCPEEIVSTSVVKPCTEPSREFEWEDEPLPRGYEYEHNGHDTCENTCDVFDIGDIYPRTAEQTGDNKPESLVDELCSLLG